MICQDQFIFFKTVKILLALSNNVCQRNIRSLIIAMHSMALEEIVEDGRMGFIAGTEKEFKEKLQLLIHNEGLRKRMGKNARECALKRSWNAVFDGLFENYKRILKKIKNPSPRRRN